MIPASPSVLAVWNGLDGFDLTITAADTEHTEFRVYKDISGSWTLIDTILTTDASTQYYLDEVGRDPQSYRVSAANGEGESPFASVPLPAIVPGVPSITAERGDPELNVSLMAADERATDFVLEWSFDHGDTWPDSQTIPLGVGVTDWSDVIAITDPGSKAATFRAKAVNSAGESAYVTAAEIPPILPGTAPAPSISSIIRLTGGDSAEVIFQPVDAQFSGIEGFEYLLEQTEIETGDVTTVPVSTGMGEGPTEITDNGDGTYSYILTGLHPDLTYDLLIGSANLYQTGDMSVTPVRVESLNTDTPAVLSATAEIFGTDPQWMVVSWTVNRPVPAIAQIRVESGDWLDYGQTDASTLFDLSLQVNDFESVIDVPSNDAYYDGAAHNLYARVKPVGADDAAYVESVAVSWTFPNRQLAPVAAPVDVVASEKSIKYVQNTRYVEDNEFSVTWSGVQFSLVECQRKIDSGEWANVPLTNVSTATKIGGTVRGLLPEDGLTHAVKFRVRAMAGPVDNRRYSDWVETPLIPATRDAEPVVIDPPSNFTVELLRDGTDVLPDQIACSWTGSDNVMIYAGFGPPGDEKWSKRLTTTDPTDNFAVLEGVRSILPRDGQQYDVTFRIQSVRGGTTSSPVFVSSPLQITARQPEEEPPPSVQAYDVVVGNLQKNQKISYADFALLVTGDINKSQIAESLRASGVFDDFRNHQSGSPAKKTFTTKETILLMAARNLTTDEDVLLGSRIAFARERVLSDPTKQAEFMAWASSNLVQDASDVFRTIDSAQDKAVFIAWAQQQGLL